MKLDGWKPKRITTTDGVVGKGFLRTMISHLLVNFQAFSFVSEKSFKRSLYMPSSVHRCPIAGYRSQVSGVLSCDSSLTFLVVPYSDSL